MTVEELIERIKDYPHDSRIGIDMIHYTLYQNDDTSDVIKGLTTSYNESSHILNLLFKR